EIAETLRKRFSLERPPLTQGPIPLESSSAEACYGLGNTLLASGDLDGAATHYRRAVALRPLRLFRGAEIHKAEAYYRLAAEQSPDSGTAHLDLGNLFQAQGKFSEAVACFQRAIEVDPDLIEAHSSLANAFRDQGKLSDAVAHYQKVVELDSTNT